MAYSLTLAIEEGKGEQGERPLQLRAGVQIIPGNALDSPHLQQQADPPYTPCRGQAFVSAGAQSTKAPPAPLDNLAGDLAIEPAAVDEEDIAMELDSEEKAPAAAEYAMEDDDGEEEEEDEQLAPIPGLGRSPSPAPPIVVEPEPTPPAFAPRGLGARGGIGARAGIGGGSGGGIGSGRAGLGSGAAPRPSASTSGPMFASATAASSMPLGGVGAPSASGAESPMAGAATPRTGLGAEAGGSGGGGGGIGSPGVGRGGIGARPAQSLVDSLREKLAAEEQAASPTSSTSPSPAPEDPPRERRSFLPSTTAAAPGVPKKISKKEQQHFAQLASSGSLGLKMLQKMGWKSGTGLGVNEQGIVTPIGEGQKLRKKGAGIASGERSAGSLAEAARMCVSESGSAPCLRDLLTSLSRPTGGARIPTRLKPTRSQRRKLLEPTRPRRRKLPRRMRGSNLRASARSPKSRPSTRRTSRLWPSRVPNPKAWACSSI